MKKYEKNKDNQIMRLTQSYTEKSMGYIEK
jgi:hypothetical protein